jgi:hypothetical protein
MIDLIAARAQKATIAVDHNVVIIADDKASRSHRGRQLLWGATIKVDRTAVAIADGVLSKMMGPPGRSTSPIATGTSDD